MTRRKKIIWILIIGIFIYLLITPFLIIRMYEKDIFYKVGDINITTKVGIVFGAGLKKNGDPSDILKDRLKAAAELYRAGKIEKILVSGDNRVETYNEPEGMKNYLVSSLGINEKDIIEDYAGRRSYDTCVRAKYIWGIDEAILISQEYHLPRVLFTCQAFEIRSIGYSATKQKYAGENWFMLREFAALNWAVLDLYVKRPGYVGGEAEKL